EDELNPWDIAAGSLIVREAGGFVSDMHGGKDVVYNNSILAANSFIHAELVSLINGRQNKKATG
ncbi:MAG: inositol monophosphatase, partial [Phototrophicales bacterium]